MTKDELMEAIKSMSVLELSDLVKALEEEFGVSAAAPVAVAAAGPAAGRRDDLSADHAYELQADRAGRQLPAGSSASKAGPCSTSGSPAGPFPAAEFPANGNPV